MHHQIASAGGCGRRGGQLAWALALQAGGCMADWLARELVPNSLFVFLPATLLFFLHCMSGRRPSEGRH